MIEKNTCLLYENFSQINQQTGPLNINNLFTQGNIVYYLNEEKRSVHANEELILSDFPTCKEWKELGLKNKKIKLVYRDRYTYEEFSEYYYLNIYNEICIITPFDSESKIIKNIINNKIIWGEDKDLLFFYFSCDEICFNSHKIMHDNSLYVDVPKNKIGVLRPIPPFPEDSTIKNYTLKIINGEMKWFPDNNDKANN